jgi:hypothetical protein
MIDDFTCGTERFSTVIVKAHYWTLICPIHIHKTLIHIQAFTVYKDGPTRACSLIHTTLNIARTNIYIYLKQILGQIFHFPESLPTLEILFVNTSL